MAHDPFDLSVLPPPVITHARRMLEEARAEFGKCPASGIFYGWWIEVFNPGCLARQGIPVYMRPSYMVSIFQSRLEDGISLIMGDVNEGAFVVMSPNLESPSIGGFSMGAEELVELGAKAVHRIPLEEAEEKVGWIMEELKPYAQVILPAGSVRRGRPTIGDIEFVVLPKDLPFFLRELEDFGYAGGDRKRSKIIEGVNVELYIAHRPEELGAMLLYATGDKVWNFYVRKQAEKHGWKLNQYGLFDRKTGKVVLQSPDERDFFDALGIDWHDPEERSLKDRPKGHQRSAR